MSVYLLHLDEPMPQGNDPRTGKPRAASHYIGYAKQIFDSAKRLLEADGYTVVEAQVSLPRSLKLFTAYPDWMKFSKELGWTETEQVQP